jgi:hypothetical protein
MTVGKLFESVRHGRLPGIPEILEFADNRGWTLAHEAASVGMLPPDFTAWEVATPNGRTVAHVAARHGHLPPGFDQWSIAKPSGWTIAHEAAEYGHLPPEFNQWELADRDGWTVAHVAATRGGLPAGYNLWELSDNSGLSVAHKAAQSGTLPDGFERWDIRDGKGRTVAHYAAHAGKLPMNFKDWEIIGDNGKTVAHTSIEHDLDVAPRGTLPTKKMKALADAFGLIKSCVSADEDAPIAVFTVSGSGIRHCGGQIHTLAATVSFHFALTRAAAAHMEELAGIMETIRPGFNITCHPEALKVVWGTGSEASAECGDICWTDSLDQARRRVGVVCEGEREAETGNFVFTEQGEVLFYVSAGGLSETEIHISRGILGKIAAGSGAC